MSCRPTRAQYRGPYLHMGTTLLGHSAKARQSGSTSFARLMDQANLLIPVSIGIRRLDITLPVKPQSSVLPDVRRRRVLGL